MSDLDTQRHITSRTYEYFCYEARLKILGENGYPLSRCIESNIHLNPLSTHIKFINEQKPGNPLRVDTELSTFQFDGKKALVFDHKLFTLNEVPVCTISLAATLTNDEEDFISSISESFSESSKLEPLQNPKRKCKAIQTEFIAHFSERDSMGDYPPGLVWRAFEEGRWNFGEKLGLTYEEFVKMDTITFFMGGKMQFMGKPKAGEKLIVETWVESVEKIRCYMRQDLRRQDGQLLASIDEEQLVVALSKARPKKAPKEYFDHIEGYLNRPQSTP